MWSLWLSSRKSPSQVAFARFRCEWTMSSTCWSARKFLSCNILDCSITCCSPISLKNVSIGNVIIGAIVQHWCHDGHLQLQKVCEQTRFETLFSDSAWRTNQITFSPTRGSSSPSKASAGAGGRRVLVRNSPLLFALDLRNSIVKNPNWTCRLNMSDVCLACRGVPDYF